MSVKDPYIARRKKKPKVSDENKEFEQDQPSNQGIRDVVPESTKDVLYRARKKEGEKAH